MRAIVSPFGRFIVVARLWKSYQIPRRRRSFFFLYWKPSVGCAKSFP